MINTYNTDDYWFISEHVGGIGETHDIAAVGQYGTTRHSPTYGQAATVVSRDLSQFSVHPHKCWGASMNASVAEHTQVVDEPAPRSIRCR